LMVKFLGRENVVRAQISCGPKFLEAVEDQSLSEDRTVSRKDRNPRFTVYSELTPTWVKVQEDLGVYIPLFHRA
jgi:hypothetical protein